MFQNMFAETHPSQGNYVAMISGFTYNIKNDKNVDLDGMHIGDLLEAKKLTWKVYAEDYPGNCFLKSTSGKYARKHVPFLSFTNVTTNPKRCSYIQDTSQFESDVKNKKLPEYSLYIPNLKDDGHDSPTSFAGQWFVNNFQSILDKKEDILFVITFDEGNSTKKNQIYTVLIHPKISPNSVNTQTLNHVSLLKMIEDEFDLGNLGQGDLTAEKIDSLWIDQ
jgi:phospholipase C